MNRRKFIKKTTGMAGSTVLTLPLVPHVGGSFGAFHSSGATKFEELGPGELLYNGIRLPAEWPPRTIDPNAFEPMPVPYLLEPPDVISIDIGRQLFVDDFLIEKTNLKRIFHKAKKHTKNPIFKPETPSEKGDGSYLPTACPKDGGIWWDPKDSCFKMWYEAGWLESMAYAISNDGVHWDRPHLDIVHGTNKILPGITSASDTIVLDLYTENPEERFKMLVRQEDGEYFVSRRKYPEAGYCMVSADGIHWDKRTPIGFSGDRTTMFYNPFRKKWIYSIRSKSKVVDRLSSPHGRTRYYREHSDFMTGANWNDDDVVFWMGADFLDSPDQDILEKPQLYNLTAVAYESLMVGVHEIHLGPVNGLCMEQGIPKITELKLGFSRDGFHWDRPNRETFISATRKAGSWERGYVQPVGGVCTVVGDQLRIYYTGFEGDEQRVSPMVKMSGTYANGSMGVATLRRDGFASLGAARDCSGTIVTRPLIFSGRYLFVNVDCSHGVMKVELLDEEMEVIAPFHMAQCIPVSADSTIHQVRWKSGNDLIQLSRKPVRIRFYLENGNLYSFWVSPDESGASYGYVAAGGPGYRSAIDTVGKEAYQVAALFPNI